MRIRSTKPEFWSSERIARLTWDARLVLKGLESYVDDNGVGRDDIALIVSDVFPRDHFASPRETVARVSEAISQLHSHGFVHRYQADGTDLLYLSWWDTIQRIDRPGKGRFRRPDGTMDYKESIIRDTLASPRDSLATGTGEQGNRGTDIYAPAEPARERPTPPPDRFEEFWSHYPKKRDKGHAVKAWKSALKKADAQTIIDGLLAQLPVLRRTDAKYIPYGATWLNGQRWEDDLSESAEADPWAHVQQIRPGGVVA